MADKDYYQVLGVRREASLDEIKKAYRKLAREYHPDTNKGDSSKEAKFKEANEAYEVLSDPQKRRTYDQFGTAGFGGSASSGGFSGFGSHGFNFDFSKFNAFGGGFSDVFESFFGGGGTATRSKNGPKRGRDLEITLNINFDEAVFGCERTFKVTAPQVCEKCKGKGHPVGTKVNTCSTCGGSGQVKRVQQSIFGQIVQATICEDCDGSGEVPDKTCSSCHGRGRARAERRVKIKIPAGVDNGSVVRVDGAGEAGIKGGAQGDLYVNLIVEASKEFQRQGSDIYSELNISIPQAVLGDEVEIKTIHGPVTLKIPAGIISGKLLRLRGKGVAKMGSERRGDHLVRITIDIPQQLSGEEARLYAELAKRLGIKIKPQVKGSWLKDLFG